jgi:hypothetical protein
MAITALPEAPSRSDDSDTFVAKADAFLAALPVMVDEITEQFSLVISETNYNGTSTTSVAIGTGSKSLTMEADKLLQIGQWVNIASAADAVNFMFGQVRAYNTVTGGLVVEVSLVGGSGTYTDWVISLSPTGATGPGPQAIRSNGTPLVVDSLDSTVSKIALQAASVTKGYVGTGASGATLQDSSGNNRVAATSAGASVTGTFDVDGTATLGDNGADTHTVNGTITTSASGAAVSALQARATHATFTGNVIQGLANRAGNSGYFLLSLGSNASGAVDAEYYVNGVGTVASDGGTAMTTPADYADAMEWADGNIGHEDRVGFSVVLVGDKVRKATGDDDPEDIIGIVSADPSVVGGSGITRWVGKYETDEFGRVVMENYEAVEWTVTPSATEEVPEPKPVLHSYAVEDLPEGVQPPDSAVYSTHQRRKLAADYDPEAPYTPRLDRAEWDPIGLCGRVRLRKGCPTNPRWRKMRDISATVEEWLVR